MFTQLKSITDSVDANNTYSVDAKFLKIHWTVQSEHKQQLQEDMQDRVLL